MKGFTLVEMLIAAAITLTLTGAVFQLIDPAHGAFRTQPESTDLQQRLRTSVESLAGNLRMAGAGASVGKAAGPLGHYLAPVMPFRAGDSESDAAADIYFRDDTISLLFVATGAGETELLGVASGVGPLPVAAQGDCLAQKRRALCGFVKGMRALVVDPRGAWDALRVAGVDDDALRLAQEGALSSSYAPGATVAQAVMHTYYLAADEAKGSYQLMHYDGAETDAPVVDDVVRLTFEYYGDRRPPRQPHPPDVGVAGGFDWPPGENCVHVVANEQHVPRLPMLQGEGLVRLTADMLTDGPWCPDAAAANRFDADLLRLRRVHVLLRVQVAAESLRGAGSLFLHPGTSPGGHRLVPDHEIRFDIAPRNLSLDR